MELEPSWLALRSVEVQRSFTNSVDAHISYLDLPAVMRIGQISRLANMLRRRGTIPYSSFMALGALLKMEPDTIRTNLRIMGRLSWLSVKTRHGEKVPYEIEEYIPRMDEVLTKLGTLYSNEMNDAEITPLSPLERATLASLHMCAKRPCSVEAVKSELSIDGKTFDKIKALGEAGRYLEPISLADKQSGIWSPIYYYNQYDTIKKFFQSQTVGELTPIGEAIELCAQEVGKPLETLTGSQKDAATAAVHVGAILPLTLWMPDLNGKEVGYTFLFPPLAKFEDSNPKGQIYEKPKVLLASLRLGENFAPTTKIRNPSLIVGKLLRDGKLGKPHSDAYDQYKVAASRGLFLLKEEQGETQFGVTYTGWVPHLIDSEENKKALEITGSLLTQSTERISTAFREDVEAADEVLKRTISCLEPLEFRGSSASSRLVGSPKLQRAAERLALTVMGGAYE
jgi:hypothetical protein